MDTRNLEARRAVRFGALALGNFAAVWGFVVAPIYLIGFGLMLSQVRAAGGRGLLLPIEVPLGGAALAALGLSLAGKDDPAGRTAGVVGLLLNLVPLIAALILWWINAFAI